MADFGEQSPDATTNRIISLELNLTIGLLLGDFGRVSVFASINTSPVPFHKMVLKRKGSLEIYSGILFL